MALNADTEYAMRRTLNADAKNVMALNADTEK